jgi:hypothetical protein
MGTGRRRTRWQGRGLRFAATALAAVLGLVVAPAGLDAAGAAFTATTVNPANSLAADQLAPPSGLTAVRDCSAAVTFTGSTTSTGVDAVALTVPPNASGKLWIVQVAHAGLPNSLTSPAGWTLIRETSNGSAVTSALYWKTASTETSVAFTYTPGGGVTLLGALAVYSGVDAGHPVDDSAASLGTSADATTPEVTTQTGGTLLVHALAKRLEVLPAPGGSTSRWSRQVGATGSGGGITGGEEPFAGPGTSSPRTSSGTTSGAWIAQTVALRRAPSVRLTWTASPSDWATGYQLERTGGTPGRTTRSLDVAGPASTTDGPLVNGTTYSYRLWAYRGNWTSAEATAILTPSC